MTEPYSKLVANYSPNQTFSNKQLKWPFPNQLESIPSQIKEDSSEIFSEALFAKARSPIDVKKIILPLPDEEVHVLRMPLRMGYVWSISEDFAWLKALLVAAESFQLANFGTHLYPFVYMTVRHGKQNEVATDVWHTDGFQGKKSERHIGEISYIWTSDGGTEWNTAGLNIPADFDSERHNLFDWMQTQKFDSTKQSQPSMLNCFDAYSVHRKNAKHGPRTIIRLTYSPVEIKDPNYTASPFFECKYDKAEPRDTLGKYE